MAQSRHFNRAQLLLYVALPLAYVICGRLGLLLAVPPGFATAFFLPAGIAVTAMFVAGSASLLGTFLGSFLLNVIRLNTSSTLLASMPRLLSQSLR